MHPLIQKIVHRICKSHIVCRLIHWDHERRIQHFMRLVETVLTRPIVYEERVVDIIGKQYAWVVLILLDWMHRDGMIQGWTSGGDPPRKRYARWSRGVHPYRHSSVD